MATVLAILLFATMWGGQEGPSLVGFTIHDPDLFTSKMPVKNGKFKSARLKYRGTVVILFSCGRRYKVYS
jgi:hypothetical protein